MSNDNSLPPRLAKKPFYFLDRNRREDPYYWLQECEEEDEYLLSHLKAENDYFLTERRRANADALFQEMCSRIPGDQESPLRRFKDHYYAMRDRQGFAYPFMVRTADKQEKASVILDLNEVAAGHSYCDFGSHCVSPDERLIAITLDTQGYGLYRLLIFNIASQSFQDTGLSQLDSDIVWTNSSDGIYYVKKTADTYWASSVYLAKLPSTLPPNTEPLVETLVYREHDRAFSVGLEKSSSDAYLFVTTHSTNSSETFFLDLNDVNATLTCFTPRQEGIEYAIDQGDNQFFLLTNQHRSNFELYQCPVACREASHWQLVYRPNDGWLLDSMDCYQDAIVVEESLGAKSRLTLVSMPSTEAKIIDFGACTVVSNLGANDYFSKKVQVEVSAMHHPARVFELDLVTQTFALINEEKVLGGFKSENYVFEQLSCPVEAEDKLPLSLCYRRDGKPLAERPLYLLGYGAYGINFEAEFCAEYLSLLDRGIIVGIIHCRGGSEQGQRWYHQGRTRHKKNTFDDFISGTKFLLNQGYGDGEKVVASGASAGGLLVGYLANEVPELYAVILAQVPFVDVLTTMLDASIPLTSGEYEEWGDPNHAEDYDRLASYSPYDNVKSQHYPAILVSSALYDGQVSFREPTKWVAKLRDCNLSDKPIALLMDLGAGHGGGSERFADLKDTAYEYAFLLEQLELTL